MLVCRDFPCSGSLTSSCGQEVSSFSSGLSMFLSQSGKKLFFLLLSGVAYILHLVLDLVLRFYSSIDLGGRIHFLTSQYQWLQCGKPSKHLHSRSVSISYKIMLSRLILPILNSLIHASAGICW